MTSRCGCPRGSSHNANLECRRSANRRRSNVTLNSRFETGSWPKGRLPSEPAFPHRYRCGGSYATTPPPAIGFLNRQRNLSEQNDTEFYRANSYGYNGPLGRECVGGKCHHYSKYLRAGQQGSSAALPTALPFRGRTRSGGGLSMVGSTSPLHCRSTLSVAYAEMTERDR
jgi:hypothetical protein